MSGGLARYRGWLSRAVGAVAAAVRAVPISVSVLVVMGVVLGVVAVAAGGSRPAVAPPGGPGATADPQAAVDRSALLARQSLVGAVDSSRRAGPPPRAGSGGDVATRGGAAVITGRVDDAAGQPLPGATVRLTRWVGNRSAAITVITGADGGFRVDGLLGGLWSATAWRAPEYVRAPLATAFLEADARQRFFMRTPAVEAPRLTLVVRGPAADPAPAGNDTDVAAVTTSSFDVEVTVRRRQAAADGSPVEQGVDATVALTYPAGHTGPAEVAVTGGVAVVRVVCATGSGPGTMGATLVGTGPAPIAAATPLPGCAPRPPTTTSTTMVRPRPTTSTTTSTSTTVAPEPTDSSVPGGR